MTKKLYEKFMDSQTPLHTPWRVYGNKTHKLICKNYGHMVTGELDNLEVISAKYSKNKDFVRVIIRETEEAL